MPNRHLVDFATSPFAHHGYAAKAHFSCSFLSGILFCISFEPSTTTSTNMSLSFPVGSNGPKPYIKLNLCGNCFWARVTVASSLGWRVAPDFVRKVLSTILGRTAFLFQPPPPSLAPMQSTTGGQFLKDFRKAQTTVPKWLSHLYTHPQCALSSVQNRPNRGGVSTKYRRTAWLSSKGGSEEPKRKYTAG